MSGTTPRLTAIDIVRQIRAATYDADGEAILQAMIDNLAATLKAVELGLAAEADWKQRSIEAAVELTAERERTATLTRERDELQNGKVLLTMHKAHMDLRAKLIHAEARWTGLKAEIAIEMSRLGRLAGHERAHLHWRPLNDVMNMMLRLDAQHGGPDAHE